MCIAVCMPCGCVMCACNVDWCNGLLKLEIELIVAESGAVRAVSSAVCVCLCVYLSERYSLCWFFCVCY